MEQLTKDELVLINNVLVTVKIFSAQEVEGVVMPLLSKLRAMIEVEKDLAAKEIVGTTD